MKICTLLGVMRTGVDDVAVYWMSCCCFDTGVGGRVKRVRQEDRFPSLEGGSK